jgi:hypothetical protein
VRFVQLFRMSLRATRDVRVTASMVDLSPDMCAQRYQHIGRRMELTFWQSLRGSNSPVSCSYCW